MKRTLFMVGLLVVLSGCATTSMDFQKASGVTGISEEVLRENCKEAVSCDLDTLKGVVQVTADDSTLWLAIGGLETRTISMVWRSDWNDLVRVKCISTELYRWPQVRRAEIYIGTEKVANVEGDVRRMAGEYNEAAGQFEKIEIVDDMVRLPVARRIAENLGDVTIRFYGAGGYTDKKPKVVDFTGLIAIAEAGQ